MRKLFVAFLILAGWTAGAQAQGTVQLQDATIAPKVMTNDLVGDVGLMQGTFTVQLYGGALGTSGASLLTGNALITFTSSLGYGFFYYAAGITVPGATAGLGSGSANNAELDIIGWSGTYSTLAEAIAAKAFTGDTGAFANATGGAGNPPTIPANLNGFPGLTLRPIPEPSTLALGGLGAVALLLVRRCK